MPCKPKVLKESDVEFRILAQQDEQSVRGNALASGDDAEDKDAEDVTVEARYAGLVGKDHLGGCNYASEADFIACADYYTDMKSEALADLQRKIDEIAPAICE